VAGASAGKFNVLSPFNVLPSIVSISFQTVPHSAMGHVDNFDFSFRQDSTAVPILLFRSFLSTTRDQT